MDDSQFFTSIDTNKLCELIEEAKESVIYAAPGLRDEVSYALTDASERLGEGMVIVCLDVDEKAVRMGYGDFSAIQQLNNYGLTINNIPNLRFALIIVDGEGYSFSPTALYLESEQSTSLGFNAIRLTAQQVQEATTRLSPAAKAIALATCDTQEQREQIAATIPEIPNTPLNEQTIKSINHSIKNNPLVNFDVTRQVRVYSSYLQYVEVKMTGAAIQRQKITMPNIFQSLGGTNKDLEGRLKTSFDLLAKDNELSSKVLENNIKELRDDFTPSLGNKHGRVMLKTNKDVFNEELNKLKELLQTHAKNVEQKLQKNINESINQIAKYYLPLVKDNPPNKLKGALGSYINDDEKLFDWIILQLDKVFPTAEKMINKMEISVVYKDVTYENLNDTEFLSAAKKAFPIVDWDKAHEEFIAASQK
jgi:hypothetical protein